MKSILLFICLALPAHALVMVSASRSVFADYWEESIERSELISSTAFGAFGASARGIPFGGGSVYAYQNSNITTAGFDLRHGTGDMYGPGGVARSEFSFTFRLDQPTRIEITAFSWAWSGVASLTGVPLAWTGPTGVPDWYNNYLNFDQTLPAGQYTFTSSEQLKIVDSYTNYRMREVSVPDGGGAASLAMMAGMMLVLFRRIA